MKLTITLLALASIIVIARVLPDAGALSALGFAAFCIAGVIYGGSVRSITGNGG